MLEAISSKILNVLDLFSPEPHPNDLQMTLELRECKTFQEKDAVYTKYGFTKGGRTKDEATDSQNM